MADSVFVLSLVAALQSMLKLCIIYAVGMGSAHIGLLNQTIVPQMSNFNFLITSPALTFVNLSRNLELERLRLYWPILVWAFINIIVGAFVGRVFCRLFRVRNEFVTSLVTATAFPNSSTLTFIIMQSLTPTSIFSTTTHEAQEAYNTVLAMVFTNNIVWNLVFYVKGYSYLLELKPDPEKAKQHDAGNPSEKMSEEERDLALEQKSMVTPEEQTLDALGSIDVENNNNNTTANGTERFDIITDIDDDPRYPANGVMRLAGDIITVLGKGADLFTTFMSRFVLTLLSPSLRFTIVMMFTNPPFLALVFAMFFGFIGPLKRPFFDDDGPLHFVITGLDFIAAIAVPLGALITAANIYFSIQKNFGRESRILRRYIDKIEYDQLHEIHDDPALLIVDREIVATLPLRDLPGVFDDGTTVMGGSEQRTTMNSMQYQPQVNSPFLDSRPTLQQSGTILMNANRQYNLPENFGASSPRSMAYAAGQQWNGAVNEQQQQQHQQQYQQPTPFVLPRQIPNNNSGGASRIPMFDLLDAANVNSNSNGSNNNNNSSNTTTNPQQQQQQQHQSDPSTTPNSQPMGSTTTPLSPRAPPHRMGSVLRPTMNRNTSLLPIVPTYSNIGMRPELYNMPGREGSLIQQQHGYVSNNPLSPSASALGQYQGIALANALAHGNGGSVVVLQQQQSVAQNAAMVYNQSSLIPTRIDIKPNNNASNNNNNSSSNNSNYNNANGSNNNYSGEVVTGADGLKHRNVRQVQVRDMSYKVTVSPFVPPSADMSAMIGNRDLELLSRTHSLINPKMINTTTFQQYYNNKNAAKNKNKKKMNNNINNSNMSQADIAAQKKFQQYVGSPIIEEEPGEDYEEENDPTLNKNIHNYSQLPVDSPEQHHGGDNGHHGDDQDQQELQQQHEGQPKENAIINPSLPVDFDEDGKVMPLPRLTWLQMIMVSLMRLVVTPAIIYALFIVVDFVGLTIILPKDTLFRTTLMIMLSSVSAESVLSVNIKAMQIRRSMMISLVYVVQTLMCLITLPIWIVLIISYSETVKGA